jgi:integrase
MGSIFLRGDSWVGEYKDRGKIKRVSFGKKGIITKTMAKEMLKKIEQKVKLGQYDMLDAEIPTLREFKKDYLRHVAEIIKKRSWKRDELCLRHLVDFFGGCKLSDITPKDVDDYKEVRLKDVSSATVNRELEVFRHLFNLAERWKQFFSKNPVSQAKLLPLNNQLERILSYEEEQRLLASSSSSLRAILICALNTGMRKSEIISLKWSNVDLDTNIITLEHTNTKSKKTRRIPINSVLRKLLLEQRLKSGGSEYVFLSSDSKPYMRHDSLNRAFDG